MCHSVIMIGDKMGQYRLSDRTENRLKTYLIIRTGSSEWQSGPGQPKNAQTMDDVINGMLTELGF